MSKLTINVDMSYLVKPFKDEEIHSYCIHQLEALQLGKTDTIYIAQELILYMFRALLYKDYKHLQSQVMFKFDGKEVEFDERMRTRADYPYSVFDECLCILVGGADD